MAVRDDYRKFNELLDLIQQLCKPMAGMTYEEIMAFMDENERVLSQNPFEIRKNQTIIPTEKKVEKSKEQKEENQKIFGLYPYENLTDTEHPRGGHFL